MNTSRLFIYTFILMLGMQADWVLGAPVTPSTSDVPDAVKAAQKKYGKPKAPPVQAAVTAAVGLKELIALQQKSCSWACLTSTFYDYRTVSKYRRHAGFHLGYDIAMQAGSSVFAGWPGTVVSIAPWYDNEWGVTIASANGMEVTYGHIVPGVSIGKTVNTGDIIGTISVNHVDVKMRDRNGSYVPFGEKGQKGISVNGTITVPEASREQLMTEWLTARNNQTAVEEEIEARSKEEKLDSILRSNLEKRYAEQHAGVKKMEQYLEDGLVSRRETEKTKQNLEMTRKALLIVKNRQKEYPEKKQKLEKQLSLCRKRTAKAQKAAEERKITWEQVQTFINNLVASDLKLSTAVKNYKKAQNDEYLNKVISLKHEIKVCETTLENQKKLYDAGGLPENEVLATTKRLQELKDSLKDLQESAK